MSRGGRTRLAARGAGAPTRARQRQVALESGDLLFFPSKRIQRVPQLGWQLVERRVCDLRKLKKNLIILLEPLDRVQRRHSFEAPDAGRETLVGGDLEGADFAGAAHVASAAELRRESGHVHDAHALAVLFTEEHERALRLRV